MNRRTLLGGLIVAPIAAMVGKKAKARPKMTVTEDASGNAYGTIKTHVPARVIEGMDEPFDCEWHAQYIRRYGKMIVEIHL